MFSLNTQSSISKQSLSSDRLIEGMEKKPAIVETEKEQSTQSSISPDCVESKEERAFKAPVLKEKLFEDFHLFRDSSLSSRCLAKLPSLNEDEKQVVINLLNEEFEIVSREPTKPSKKTTLAKIAEELERSFKASFPNLIINRSKFIGGIVRHCLPSSFWKRVFSNYKIPEKDLNVFFPVSPKPDPVYLGQRGDCDFALELGVKNCKTKEQEIQFLSKNMDEIKGLFIKTLVKIIGQGETFYTVKNSYFQELMLVNDKENIFLMAKFGNRQDVTIEFKLCVKLALPYLFPQDIFAISITDEGDSQAKEITVECQSKDANFLPHVLSYQTDELHFSKPALANKKVWPRFISHLTMGKENRKQSIAETLYQKAHKECPTFQQKLFLFQDCLANHHANDPLANIAFYINACQDKIGYLTNADKRLLWTTAKESKIEIDAPNLLSLLHRHLIQDPQSTETILLVFQFLTTQYFSKNKDKWNQSDAFGILVRSFENQPFLKIVVKGPQESLYAIWLPFKQSFDYKALQKAFQLLPSLSTFYERLTIFYSLSVEDSSDWTGMPEKDLLALYESLTASQCPVSCHYGLTLLSFLQTASPRLCLVSYAIQALPYALAFYKNSNESVAFLKNVQKKFFDQNDASFFFKNLTEWLEKEEEISKGHYRLLADLIESDSPTLLNHAYSYWTQIIETPDPSLGTLAYRLIKKLIPFRLNQALKIIKQCRQASVFSSIESFELFISICKQYQQHLEKQTGYIELSLQEIEELEEFFYQIETPKQLTDNHSLMKEQLGWLCQTISRFPKKGATFIAYLCDQGWLEQDSVEREECYFGLIEHLLKSDESADFNQAQTIWQDIFNNHSNCHDLERRNQLIYKLIENRNRFPLNELNDREAADLIQTISHLPLSDSLESQSLRDSLLSHFNALIKQDSHSIAATQLKEFFKWFPVQNHQELYKRIIKKGVKVKDAEGIQEWFFSFLSHFSLTDARPLLAPLVGYFVDQFLHDSALSVTLDRVARIGKFLKRIEATFHLFDDHPSIRFSCWALTINSLLTLAKTMKPFKQDLGVKLYYSIADSLLSNLLPALYAQTPATVEPVKQANSVLLNFFKDADQLKPDQLSTHPLIDKYLLLLEKLAPFVEKLITLDISLKLGKEAEQTLIACHDSLQKTSRSFSTTASLCSILDFYLNETPCLIQDACKLVNTSLTPDWLISIAPASYIQTIERLGRYLIDRTHLEEASHLTNALLHSTLNAQFKPVLNHLIFQLVQTRYSQMPLYQLNKNSLQELQLGCQKQIISREEILNQSKQTLERLQENQRGDKAFLLFSHLKEAFKEEEWGPIFLTLLDTVLHAPQKEKIFEASQLMKNYFYFLKEDTHSRWQALIEKLITHQSVAQAWEIFEFICVHDLTANEDRRAYFIFLLSQTTKPVLNKLQLYLTDHQFYKLIDRQASGEEKASLYQLIMQNLLELVQIKTIHKFLPLLNRVMEKRNQIKDFLVSSPITHLQRRALDKKLIELLCQCATHQELTKAVDYLEDLLEYAFHPSYATFEFQKLYSTVMKALESQYEMQVKLIPLILKLIEKGQHLGFTTSLDYALAIRASNISFPANRTWFNRNPYVLNLSHFKTRLEIEELVEFCENRLQYARPLATPTFYQLDKTLNQLVELCENRLKHTQPLATPTFHHLDKTLSHADKSLLDECPKLAIIRLKIKMTIWNIYEIDSHQETVDFFCENFRSIRFHIDKATERELLENIFEKLMPLISGDQERVKEMLPTWKTSCLKICGLISSFKSLNTPKAYYNLYCLMNITVIFRHSYERRLSKDILAELLEISLMLFRENLTLSHTYTIDLFNDFVVKSLNELIEQVLIHQNEKSRQSLDAIFTGVSTKLPPGTPFIYDLIFNVLCPNSTEKLPNRFFLAIEENNSYKKAITDQINAFLKSVHPLLFLYGSRLFKLAYQERYENPREFLEALENLLKNPVNSTPDYQGELINNLIEVFSNKELPQLIKCQNKPSSFSEQGLELKISKRYYEFLEHMHASYDKHEDDKFKPALDQVLLYLELIFIRCIHNENWIEPLLTEQVIPAFDSFVNSSLSPDWKKSFIYLFQNYIVVMAQVSNNKKMASESKKRACLSTLNKLLETLEKIQPIERFEDYEKWLANLQPIYLRLSNETSPH